ncbi:ATP-binding protein [Streptomyces hoynatensis]|uniref:ATP-binding protein n=1 Tax=Streptomyces hoynatensis TaxID=1141874 RepID=A0A3A9YYR8_9ACTN|nr:ATP-binding protein [Streptomyces hoynatensis]RKN40356.1 ATP-binding protein [Streptomyces hoynatensis]
MPEIPSVPALWHFPARPASVMRARHTVARALPKGLLPGLTDDLGLLTSELVTNAIRHGSHREDDLVELVLWPADGHYWIAVSDRGPTRPLAAPARPDADAETGRGLFLVDRLAAAWGVRTRPVRGTSVIAGLPIRRGG